jgi:mono/diheme cytochrome c family protein
MADKARSIRAILHGLAGEIEVNGRKFNGTMAPMQYLSDAQVADVLTYVRNSFGNEGDSVSGDEVRTVRGEVPPPASETYE